VAGKFTAGVKAMVKAYSSETTRPEIYLITTARRAKAQKPTTAKVNQMMPKRFSFHMETNK